MTLPPWCYPVLFLSGVVAGFVDSIAGGGGLITLPVLLNVGLAPQEALGTNKLQAVFGSGSATWHYRRAGLVSFRASRLGMLCTFVGAVAGSLLVQQVNPEVLQQIIPWLLMAIALYVLFVPRMGEADAHSRMAGPLFHLLFGFGLGFYDGFFGPGTGTLWAMAYVVFLGLNLTRATAHTKLMNFTSNVASIGVFLWFGQANYLAGLCMGVGQIVGARLGSRAVIQRGTKFIRPIFVAVVLAMTARLLWRNF